MSDRVSLVCASHMCGSVTHVCACACDTHWSYMLVRLARNGCMYAMITCVSSVTQLCVGHVDVRVSLVCVCVSRVWGVREHKLVLCVSLVEVVVRCTPYESDIFLSLLLHAVRACHY